MANVVVVFATKEGQTGKIARYLAAALRANDHVVELVDADRDPLPQLDRFRAAIVCAPIHAGGYPRSIARFARMHRAFLERVPSVFLSVGLALLSRTHDGRVQTLEIIEKFARDTGWHPARVELAAGALPYSKYNFLIRFVMRRITAKEGGDTDTSQDYEYTDWSALDRLAAEFVTGVEA